MVSSLMVSTVMAIAVVVLCVIAIYFYKKSIVQTVLWILGVGAIGGGIFALSSHLEWVLLFLIAVFTGFQLMSIALRLEPEKRLPYFLGTIALDRLLMMSVPLFWLQLPNAVRMGWTYGAIAIAAYLVVRLLVRSTLKDIFLRQ